MANKKENTSRQTLPRVGRIKPKKIAKVHVHAVGIAKLFPAVATTITSEATETQRKRLPSLFPSRLRRAQQRSDRSPNLVFVPLIYACVGDRSRQVGKFERTCNREWDR